MQKSPVESQSSFHAHEGALAVYAHVLYRHFKVCPMHLLFRATAVSLQVEAGAFPTVQLAASA